MGSMSVPSASSAVDDFGRADEEFAALAPHGLDEDGKVELAAPGDEELAGELGLLHAQADVALQFGHQARAQLAAGEVLAVAAGEGAVVDAKGHAHGRLFHGNRRQGARVVGIGKRVADAHIFDAGDGDDAAGLYHVHFLALEVAEDVGLGDLARLPHAFGGNVHDCCPLRMEPLCKRPIAILPT